MSFILDALKKSESDRQRQSGPSLFEVKVAPPRRALPLWAMAIAVLLGINIIVVSWMLLRHPAGQQQAAGITAPAALQPERVPAAVYSGAGMAPSAAGIGQPPYAAFSGPPSGGGPRPATPGGGASPVTAPSGTAPSGAPPGAAPPGAASFGSASAGAAENTGPQLPAAARPPEGDRAMSASAPGGDTATPRGGVDEGAGPKTAQGADRDDAGNDAPAVQPDAGSSGGTGDLPVYQQIVSSAGLPALHLDLHVFAGRPQDRFVMINMHRLGEGDSLPSGVQVDAIRPDGVVLSYHGTRFLLPRN